MGSQKVIVSLSLEMPIFRICWKRFQHLDQGPSRQKVNTQSYDYLILKFPSPRALISSLVLPGNRIVILHACSHSLFHLLPSPAVSSSPTSSITCIIFSYSIERIASIRGEFSQIFPKYPGSSTYVLLFLWLT